ncbi:hypothetical protein D8M04_13475 [Oceanobacillus piezotolerans]|uniref:Uncharacterized protein n=1 Tax=Oceanobacillus piezotolerans TaxID=2448030 RepID=A0A498DLQ4_9BACI|nr:hypothetical protein [Oceanobacillus piezotolerans]RLL43909.1 hypothetical protein D8M04_13475 [Oceanobacillus piezotolerans]
MQPINHDIKLELLKLVKRAEKYSKDHLVNTFVDTGALATLLTTIDNQILYGRRGTGKTHALAYLSNVADGQGDYVVDIDMSNIGSTGGIYGSFDIPVTERATRLLVDTLIQIHENLLNKVMDDVNKELDPNLLPLLDELADALSQVYVEGSTEITQGYDREYQDTTNDSIDGSVNKKGIELNLSMQQTTNQRHNQSVSKMQSGVIRHRVHFGSVQSVMKKILKKLNGKRLWILIDEWSEIPLELQPYLADLLRRSIFPLSDITVKIAAIEQRSKFKSKSTNRDYIGLEIGGDASAILNLDSIMVFNNDQEKAKDFFEQLLYTHIKALIESKTGEAFELNSEKVINEIFTQQKAFEEFVKAAEGVPRDAINIIGIAVLNSGDNKISIPNIRSAAKSWYNRAKERDIINAESKKLLRWIIEEVIAHRKARAFLLKTDTYDELINDLFDARLIHVLKENVSARDRVGERFVVYSIDYGCYVDLLQTANAPQGLFEAVVDDESEVYVEVPSDDYRSIRRAILNLEEFYESTSEQE